MSIEKLTLPAKENAVQLKINEIIDNIYTNDIFIAEYNQTTFQEVLNAYNAGKMIFADLEQYYYPLSMYSTNLSFTFSSPDIDGIYQVTITNDDTWSDNTFAIQSQLNSKQPTLVSGTNIKTINNISILGSGNIDTSEIFVATYGTTSYSDVLTAYNAGKTIICKNGEVIGYLYDYSAGCFYFYAFSISSSLYATCKLYQLFNTNNWITGKNYELASADLHNVSSINSNSAVSTALDGKADTDLSNLSANGKLVLDGQWVFNYKELTTATSAGSREHDLSTYLPSDSSSYEVFATVRLASTSSSTIEISLGTSASPVTNTTSCINIYASKSGTTSYSVSNTGILPVGTGRKLYSQISGGNANVSWIRVYGYRRIGTNT